jgi:hypothetical protein
MTFVPQFGFWKNWRVLWLPSSPNRSGFGLTRRIWGPLAVRLKIYILLRCNSIGNHLAEVVREI